MVEHKDPFYIRIAQIINQHGRQIIAVAPEKKKQAFFYTIGNSVVGAPELLIIWQLGAKRHNNDLNKLSEQMLEAGKRYGNGQRINLGGEHDLQVWDTTPVAKIQYTRQATEFFNQVITLCSRWSCPTQRAVTLMTSAATSATGCLCCGPPMT